LLRSRCSPWPVTERSAVGPTARDAAPVAGPAIGPQLGPGANNGNGILHRVSVGGPDVDFIGPGGDANYSIVAIQHGDGSVSGQYTDQFGHGNGGFHAEVNCLSVLGNQAWISGVIKSGSTGGFDLTGLPVITRVRDNGTSANDAPDQISFSFIGDPTPCTARPLRVLFAMSRGQVTVD
jgi:hypothetical protein